MGSYPLIIMFLIRLLKYHQEVAENRKDFIEQLKNGSSQLVETNIQLQEYVLLKEDQAIFAERKRLSREIHDIIGHTLMSIILMMKAATRLSDEKKGQLHDFLLKTKDQAQKGLNETRRALRILRSTGTPKLTLVTAMNRIAKAFQATHIKIRIHYGNIPWSFNEQIDLIIYRAVQEGITNSLRHGNAQKIDIFFWYDNGIIQVTINDDGVGCEVFSFGIGLNGIRERLDEFNGYFEAKNTYEGFQLKLCIPWMQGD